MPLPITIAGLLLITTGISHISQLWKFPPSTMLKFAVGAGVIYALMGILILVFRLQKLALPVALLCGLGFMTGSYRLFFLEFSVYGLAHQLMHVVIIACCLYSFFTVQRSKTPALGAE